MAQETRFQEDHRQYSYNSLSRRYHLAYSGSTGATIGYIYSPAGDLTNLDHNLAASADSPHYTFTYTDAHEVQTEDNTKPAYVWQPSATGTTGYAPANSLNQYPSYTAGLTPRPLGYDLKGNLTSGNLDGSGVWAFGYDAENRMTSACKPAAGGVCASPTVNASYKYDPLGRRVEKSGAGVTKTWFVNDGDDEIAEYGSGNNPTVIYVPGPAIDEPIAMVTGFGATLAHAYFHTNYQGSVIAMSDDSGNKIEGPYTYDPYGNCFAGSTPCGSLASSEPFKFTGRRLDPETGLLFYRARYYSAQLGRFLQTDPVGYTADLNLYTYVGNDPVNRTDPTGLDGCVSVTTTGSRIATQKCYKLEVKTRQGQNGATNFRAFVHWVTGGGRPLVIDFSKSNVSGLEEKIGKSAYGQYGQGSFQKAIEAAQKSGKPAPVNTPIPIDVETRYGAGEAIGRVETDVSGYVSVNSGQWKFTGAVTARGERFDFNSDLQGRGPLKNALTVGVGTYGHVALQAQDYDALYSGGIGIEETGDLP